MKQIIFIFALLAFSGFAFTSEYQELSLLWSTWKSFHSKTYSSAEDAARYAIFVDNYDKVAKHNAGHSKAKLRLNQFADLAAEEFKNIHSGCARYEEDELFVKANTIGHIYSDIPASVDWRTQNAVTPIKNQGQCGGCWTFSTTGVLEGYYSIHNGQLLSFSEQQILDCASSGFGCNGGWPYLAIQYAASNGLQLESEYPYAGETGTCKFNQGQATKINNGYAFVENYNSDAVKTALVNSPVSVLIEADQTVFQFYDSGVIGPDDQCGSTVDHAVLAVGYGTYEDSDAFIVKNSWGTSWGENGYVYLSTNGTVNGGAGVCGILSQPVIPN